MTTTITALSAGTALSGTEVFPADQSGATVKTTAAQIAAYCGVAKYVTNIGDGVSVSYTVTHSLGTKDVRVTMYRNASPFEEIIADVQHSTTNTITVLFSIAPTTNQFRVLVWA